MNSTLDLKKSMKLAEASDLTSFLILNSALEIETELGDFKAETPH